MALDEYKPRFLEDAPEPSGGSRRKGSELFCVQKHLASHLHYDFRLEPQRRMYMLSHGPVAGRTIAQSGNQASAHTDGSPFRLRRFEGVIPEGYGAGIVMLGTAGTWTPESDRYRQGPREGDLKFTLDGLQAERLVGARAHGRTLHPAPAAAAMAGRWLLIKHRDDFGQAISTSRPSRAARCEERGDFADILAARQSRGLARIVPPRWRHGRHVCRIIRRAAAIESQRLRHDASRRVEEESRDGPAGTSETPRRDCGEGQDHGAETARTKNDGKQDTHTLSVAQCLPIGVGDPRAYPPHLTDWAARRRSATGFEIGVAQASNAARTPQPCKRAGADRDRAISRDHGSARTSEQCGGRVTGLERLRPCSTA